MFKLPSLPKEWYHKLKQLCEGHQMSQWQVILLGLHCILILGQKDPDKLAELAAKVRLQYQKSSDAWGPTPGAPVKE